MIPHRSLPVPNEIPHGFQIAGKKRRWDTGNYNTEEEALMMVSTEREYKAKLVARKVVLEAVCVKPEIIITKLAALTEVTLLFIEVACYTGTTAQAVRDVYPGVKFI